MYATIHSFKIAAATLTGGILAQGGAQEPAAMSTQIESVWDFVLKGGPMMIPIAACSLVAVTIIVERLVTLRRRGIIPPEFLPRLKTLMNGGHDRAPAIEHCDQDGSPLATILAAGIRRLSQSMESIERGVQEAGERVVFKLRRNLRALSVIAAICPLLGLLGTIFGMIKAFQTVANSGEALGKTELLAEGIYQAMITTAAGLLVAIPVIIAYHWLSSRIDRMVHEMDHMTVEFVEEYAEPAVEPHEETALRFKRSNGNADDEREVEEPRAVAARSYREGQAVLIRAKQAPQPIPIEMTPIIDMVFLLLIFFLVATTFQQAEREMQIALPVAANSGPISATLREIVVNVDENGRIIVSGRAVDAAQLSTLVADAVKANPDQKVTVRGDRQTAYANIVQVLDICKGSGIQEPYLDTVLVN